MDVGDRPLKLNTLDSPKFLDFPCEIILMIIESADTLDILNLQWACKRIKKLCDNFTKTESFKNNLRIRIYELSGSDFNLSLCISSILLNTNIYNDRIVRMISRIYSLIKGKSKYFGILGYSIFYVYLHKSPEVNITYIGPLPVLVDDTYIMNVYYPDLDNLRYHLERFLDFKNESEYTCEPTHYRIKNYKVRYILNV